MRSLAVPTLAAVVSAQTTSQPSYCTADTVTYSHSSQLAGCTTFPGSIVIPTGIGEFDPPNSIYLDVEEIGSYLTIQNSSNLNQISMPNLRDTKFLYVENCPALSLLDVPNLQELSELRLTNLTNLTNVRLGNALSVDALYIVNTSLVNTYGLEISTADAVEVANNTQLNFISLGIDQSVSQPDGVTVRIDSNGNQVTVSFDKLTKARELIFRQIKSLYLPLIKTTSSLSIVDSPDLSEITLDTLTGAGSSAATSTNSSIEIRNNSDITKASFAAMIQSDGNLEIQDNPKLATVNLGSLQRINGNFNISTGNFTSLPLDNLTTVEGSMNIESLENITALCNSITSRSFQYLTLKSLTCRSSNTSVANVTDTSNGPTKPGNSPPSTSSLSKTLSTSAKAGIGIGVAVFVLLVVGLAFLVYQRKRRATTKRISAIESIESIENEKVDGQHGYGYKPELSGSTTNLHETRQGDERAELARTNTNKSPLLGVKNRHELSGDYGDSELADTRRHELE